jgi:hypothetical protein
MGLTEPGRTPALGTGVRNTGVRDTGAGRG